LLNFCYWVNVSCVVSVLYAPNSAWLWRLNYACNNGWSLLRWKYWTKRSWYPIQILRWA
jgi:hypothetical protein